MTTVNTMPIPNYPSINPQVASANQFQNGQILPPTQQGQSPVSPPLSVYRSVVKGLLVMDSIHNLFSAFTLVYMIIMDGATVISIGVKSENSKATTQGICVLVFSLLVMLIVLYTLYAATCVWAATKPSTSLDDVSIKGWFFATILLILIKLIVVIVHFFVPFLPFSGPIYYTFTFSVTLHLICAWFISGLDNELSFILPMSAPLLSITAPTSVISEDPAETRMSNGAFMPVPLQSPRHIVPPGTPMFQLPQVSAK